jgi:hypothetical protein
MCVTYPSSPLFVQVAREPVHEDEQKAQTYAKWISHSLTTPEGQLGYCAALILNKTGYICGRLTFPIMCSILS